MASQRLSELKKTLSTGPECTRTSEGQGILSTAGGPKHERVVLASGGEPSPIGAERQTEDRIALFQRGERIRRGVGVPEPDCPISASGGEGCTIPTESESHYRSYVTAERLGDDTGIPHVPQISVALPVPAANHLPSGLNADTEDEAAAGLEEMGRASGLSISRS